jgi:hypothetical protein
MLGVVLIWIGILPASAHFWNFTTIGMIVQADGTFELDLYFDLNALMIGVDPGHIDGELWVYLLQMNDVERQRRLAELNDFLLQAVTIRFDGKAAMYTVSFPEMDAALAKNRRGPALPGSVARFAGTVPEGARELTIEALPEFGPIITSVRLGESGPLSRVLIDPGERSEPFGLGRGSGSGSTMAAAWRDLRLGFAHIVPQGLEHILLVLGLYLLNTRLSALLAQVTAFTVAHTAGLALSLYGVVSLPSSLVEPLIALSIVYVAAENLSTSELKPWRTAILFGLGLLHGLGLAGALQELGLSRGEYLTALVTFNVGLELGQLAVVGLAFLAAGWFRSRAWYRLRLAVPASIVIGLVGIYWTVERVFTS